MPRWGDGLHGERLPEYRVVVTERTRRGVAKRHTFVLVADTWNEDGGPHWARETKNLPLFEPLGETVHLADGVDVAASALTVILEARVSQGRHQVDLADIKVVVSQLGSRLAALDTLTAEQRQLAEPALYAEIVRRCTPPPRRSASTAAPSIAPAHDAPVRSSNRAACRCPLPAHAPRRWPSSIRRSDENRCGADDSVIC